VNVLEKVNSCLGWTVCEISVCWFEFFSFIRTVNSPSKDVSRFCSKTEQIIFFSMQILFWYEVQVCNVVNSERE